MKDRRTPPPVTSRVPHPGSMLRRKLEEKGWTQDELAAITGHSRQTISNIVGGKSGITAEMAVALGAAFGTDPGEWLRWDAEYALAQIDAKNAAIERRAALYAAAPIRDMQKRGWINETSDLEELEGALSAFFGQPLNEGIAFPVAARRKATLAELNPAEKAWCFRARQLAAAVVVNRFSVDRLDLIERRLRQFAAYHREVERLPAMLAEHGIKFVVVEPLPGAKIDGAAFRVDDNPAIAVSVRFDRIDAFWFTVMHEFAHIKNGDDYSVDSNLLSDADKGIFVVLALDDAERRANDMASDMLVPTPEMDSFVRRLSPLYSKQNIIQFAHRIKMHPGIIVGQLQHRREVAYSSHRDLLVKVRSLITQAALTDGWGQSMVPGLV